MVTTPNLALTLIDQSQSQKEVTANNAFIRMEVPLIGAVDRAINTPPGSPANGDSYIVGGSPTGAWAGKANNLAYYYGGWYFIVPKEGLSLWVNDEDIFYTWNGTSWIVTNNPTSFQNLSLLGINTTADATNKLAVASSAILFTNIGNGIQAKLNKNAVGDSAGFLFQTGFSGRAEFGTLGDDNFTLKVSSDGTTFFDVLKMMASTGRMAFKSIATGISAAGSTQGTATALTKTINIVSTVAASQGARLPSPEAGEFLLVANQGANALSLYPNTGHTINALAANTALSLAADTRRLFFAATSTNWYSI
jgi:hypothetical protein